MATTIQKTTNASRLRTFIRTLFAHLLGTIFQPIPMFGKFLVDRQRQRYTWSAILLISVGYALVDAALYSGRESLKECPRYHLMKTTKVSGLQPLLGPLVLLILLLSACGGSILPEGRITPTPTGSVITPTPTPAHLAQYLVYVYKDTTNTWHLSRYDSRTGRKNDLYTTAAGQISEVQVSADGKQVLFLTELYPAMRTDASARIQVIRVDGQGLQTLSSVAIGSTVSGLEWSPDQRVIAFQERSNVYLLDVASRTSRLAVPAQGERGFVPRTWLDNTRLYLAPYTPSETPPLQLSLLDSSTNRVQQVLSLPALGGDFDSSIDGTTLFTSQYSFAMPVAGGPSSIEAQPATGGQATMIYRTPDNAITGLRVASRTCLLFIIHNTGVGNMDTSHNGLWKIKMDGTGLSRLTSEAGDELTMFPSYTQYVWSSVSRDGSLYAVKLVSSAGPNASASLLIGSMSGGKLASIASTDNASTLEIAGWIQE